MFALAAKAAPFIASFLPSIVKGGSALFKGAKAFGPSILKGVKAFGPSILKGIRGAAPTIAKIGKGLDAGLKGATAVAGGVDIARGLGLLNPKVGEREKRVRKGLVKGQKFQGGAGGFGKQASSFNRAAARFNPGLIM